MFDLLVHGLGFLFALVLVFRLAIRRTPVWAVGAGLCLLAFIDVAVMFFDPLFAFDYRPLGGAGFWEVGRDVWAGINPYAPDRFRIHAFLNPPTALPLFAVFATLPVDTSTAIWTLGNALGVCGLVPFSQRVLVAQDSLERSGRTGMVAWRLPPCLLAGLTGIVAASTASLMGFATGQLSLLVTFALLAALNAQARAQPIRAGLWLALATIKVTTMLPFLLLFTRWADRKTWISLAAGIAALTIIATPPTELADQLRLMVDHIKELQEPGRVNDYSFEGTQHSTMLGMDHALYRLGMRNPSLIQAGQYVLLGELGLAVGCVVISRRLLPRAAACSLIAAFSGIFLYHRVYDAVVLVVPLLYCTGWARAAEGAARWVFASSALGILLVLYLPKDLLIYLTDVSQHAGHFGWLIQAIILPYATWCVLAVMVGVVVGARLISNIQVAKHTTGTQK